VSTSGVSWLGTPNPPFPFDQEHGNSLFFGLAVESFGSTFKMKDVTFSINIGTFSGTSDLSGVEFSAHTVGYTCLAPPLTSGDLSNCTAHNTAGGVGVDDDLDINFLFTSGLYVSDFEGDPQTYAHKTLQSGYQLPDSTNGGDSSTLSTSAVPEPGTFALLGVGLGLALRFRRKR
jgi:hypothetical protein